MLPQFAGQVSSTWAHYKRGAVDGALLRLLLPGLVPGALLGGWLADKLPSALLARIFGEEKLSQLEPLVSVVGGMAVIAHNNERPIPAYSLRYETETALEFESKTTSSNLAAMANTPLESYGDGAKEQRKAQQ